MSEPKPSTRTQRVRVGSLSLRYSVTGTEGRPLLLVNGVGANIEMWEPFRRSLGSRHTIAFDAPGTGSSSTPNRPLTMRELGTVTIGLLDCPRVRHRRRARLFVRRLDRAGDGRVDPARIHRLVLAAASCGWGSVPGDPFALLAMLTPARYYFLPATAAVNALFGAEPAQPTSPPPMPPGCIARPTRSATGGSCSPRIGWSSLPWLHRVRAPTLVLAAARDRLVRASTARTLARRIPDARLEVVPDANHFFLLREDTRAASQLVTSFLDERGAGQSRRGVGLHVAAVHHEQRLLLVVGELRVAADRALGRERVDGLRRRQDRGRRPARGASRPRGRARGRSIAARGPKARAAHVRAG